MISHDDDHDKRHPGKLKNTNRKSEINSSTVAIKNPLHPWPHSTTPNSTEYYPNKHPVWAKLLPRFFVLLLCVVCMTEARAVEPVELVDEQLRREPVQIVSLGDDRLSYFNAQRQLQQVSTGGFVALNFPKMVELTSPERIAEWEGATIQLVDGQRIAGKFAGVTAEGKLQWASVTLGTTEFAMDRVVSFSIGEKIITLPADEEQATDRVVLVNGDVVRGFVQAMKPDGLVIQVDGKEMKLEWKDRVSRVLMPNPIKVHPGHWLRLTDGSRLRIEGMLLEGQKVTGKVLGGKPVEVATSQVMGIDFAVRQRLVRLADLPYKVTAGGEVFGVKWEPRFTANDVAIHAPLTLRFELPEGAVRLAMEAEVEPQSLDVADMTLSVLDGAQVIVSQRLNADKPRASIVAPVHGGSVTLKLDEGPNGPVRDRLVLRGAVVLVKNGK